MSESHAERTAAIFASAQNKKLVARLRAERGVKLIEFPDVKAEPVEPETAAGEEILANPTDFDWLIFPDPFAVEFFLELLNERGFDLFALDELRVCALGEAVADRLRFVQLHADIIPPRTDAENVFSALADYLSSAEEFRNLRFLLPAEISYFSPLAEMIGAAGASVRHFPVYRLTVENEASAGLSRLEALLAGGAIDEFVFSSAAEAFNLENLFRRDLKTLLADASVSVAADEIAFQTLRERGLRPLYLTKK
jgi:uroporphyrinogen-III synthase